MISNMIPVLVVVSALALLVYICIGSAIANSGKIPCFDHCGCDIPAFSSRGGCSRNCTSDNCRYASWHKSGRCPGWVVSIAVVVLWPIIAAAWIVVKIVSPPINLGKTIGNSLTHQEEVT